MSLTSEERKKRRLEREAERKKRAAGRKRTRLEGRGLSDAEIAEMMGRKPLGTRIKERVLLGSEEYRAQQKGEGIDPLDTVLKFEEGDRATRHFNPGAHIWTPSLERLFKAEKGDPFTDESGATYFTAKYPDEKTGMEATKYVVDKIWKETGEDSLAFASAYTGSPIDSEVVKSYAADISTGISTGIVGEEPKVPPGRRFGMPIEGGMRRGAMLQNLMRGTSPDQLRRAIGMGMLREAGMGQLPKGLTPARPGESWEEFYERDVGTPLVSEPPGYEPPAGQGTVLRPADPTEPIPSPHPPPYQQPIPTVEAPAPLPEYEPTEEERKSVTPLGKANKFLGQPSVLNTLSGIAMSASAAYPQSWQYQMAKGVSDRTQTQMQDNYLGRLMAGESPGEIKGPDVSTLSPELREKAISQYLDIQKEAKEETPEQRFTRETTKEGGKRMWELAKVEINNANKIVQDVMKTIPNEMFVEGELNIAGLEAAVLGGQELRTDLQTEAFRGALTVLRRSGMSTYGLEWLAGFPDITSAPGEATTAEAIIRKINNIPLGSAFVNTDKEGIKRVYIKLMDGTFEEF